MIINTHLYAVELYYFLVLIDLFSNYWIQDFLWHIVADDKNVNPKILMNLIFRGALSRVGNICTKPKQDISRIQTKQYKLHHEQAMITLHNMDVFNSLFGS